MALGKLYKSDKFIGDVNYHFHDDSEASWWGELILTEYKRVSDGDGYVIELQDGRRGSCFLKKRINRAVSGPPPLYYYYFRGCGLLK